MFTLEKFEKFYEWLCRPNPILVDITVGVIAVLIILTMINMVGSFVWWLFGWALIPLFIGVLGIVSVTYFIYAHKNGGIKEWWKSRPWVK